MLDLLLHIINELCDILVNILFWLVNFPLHDSINLNIFKLFEKLSVENTNTLSRTETKRNPEPQPIYTVSCSFFVQRRGPLLLSPDMLCVYVLWFVLPCENGGTGIIS
jgi:hypothetical protein